LEHVLFFHIYIYILGIIIPSDFHIFLRGWHHQPDHHSVNRRCW
jgi:hypothetical protein